MSKSKFAKLGAVAATVLLLASLVAGPAEARMGGSFGSRGSRTFSTPSITRVAPAPTAPIQRSMTPNTGPTTPGYQQPNGFNRGGFWSGLGGGLLGGMLGGLLFHGLFGSMLGFGFGGIGGGFSMIFQLLIVGGLIWLAFRWFGNRRQQPAGSYGQGFPFGGASQSPYNGPAYGGSGYSSTGSTNRDEVGISNTDLETFERMLGEVQAAFAREDHQGLRRLSTPEMVSYFSEELADNATHGLRNDVTDLKFLEGELAEAWREGNRDYATVAMHWSAIDVMRDRQTGEVKQGDPDHPVEGRELWTFVRENGGNWLLSAIQDAR